MMKYRFQSFMDVSTSAETMQILQFSVGGADVLQRCQHLFGAYKYFKLGKISIKMVPASTLPVDPAGLSYESDDPQTVDPRDQMSPGLVRITNGEDIFTNVSALSVENQIKCYHAMMLDPRWSKFMLQSGFRRSAYPLYWQVGQLSQDKYPGSVENVPWFNSGQSGLYSSDDGTISEFHSVKQGSTNVVGQGILGGSSARGLFQTGHRGKLGFLPTDFFQELVNQNGGKIKFAGVNNIPEVSVITCVLPKAYKTVYYYRIFITEEVIFSGLRTIPPEGYPGIDQFVTGTISAFNAYSSTTTTANNNGDRLP